MTVFSWPVCLGFKHPCGAQDQIFITACISIQQIQNFHGPTENTTSYKSSGVVCVHCLVMALLMLCIYSYIAIGWQCLFLWLHNSFLQQICHIASSLRLVIPSSLYVNHRLFYLHEENSQDWVVLLHPCTQAADSHFSCLGRCWLLHNG